MSTQETPPNERVVGSADSSDVTPESLLRKINELAGVSGQDAGTMPGDSGPVFLAPWEARAFAMVVSLNQQGHFSWPEWVGFFSVEIANAMAAEKPTHGPAYYLLWLSAAEKLLASKDLLQEEEYARARSAFALDHPHPCIHELMHEHDVIHDMLDAFERCVQSLEGNRVASAEMLAFVDFFAAFVERLHDDKEEDLLFQVMIANGFPEDGPIAVMRDEHQQGSRYLSELRAAATSGLQPSTRDQAAATAQRYIQLLRQHVTKENGDLYPAAHAQLSEEVLLELDRACRDYDASHGEERAALLAIAEDLTRV